MEVGSWKLEPLEGFAIALYPIPYALISYLMMDYYTVQCGINKELSNIYNPTSTLLSESTSHDPPPADWDRLTVVFLRSGSTNSVSP